jgi:hypothetical protein
MPQCVLLRYQEVAVFDLVPSAAPFSVGGLAYDDGFELSFSADNGMCHRVRYGIGTVSDSRADAVACWR